nr:cysteine hydrolase [Clostridium acetobutylicum]
MHITYYINVQTHIRRITVIYFCPFHRNAFNYLNDDFRYTGFQRQDKTIIDNWNTVSTPPAPTLKPVKIDPRNTALLILDMENTLCTNPECRASIPKIRNLLVKARENNIPVIYSLRPTATALDVIKPLAPLPMDLVVRSGVDKFYKTNLGEILQQKNIKNVIVTGYAANGAVLHTATGAALRNYNVIVPVDAVSADVPYAEQYTAWHMINSPGTRDKAVLTRTNLISI